MGMIWTAFRAQQVGGNTNFAIAAARLGLECTCLGHTGDDFYGQFVADVLRKEGVRSLSGTCPAGTQRELIGNPSGAHREPIGSP